MHSVEIGDWLWVFYFFFFLVFNVCFVCFVCMCVCSHIATDANPEYDCQALLKKLTKYVNNQPFLLIIANIDHWNDTSDTQNWVSQYLEIMLSFFFRCFLVVVFFVGFDFFFFLQKCLFFYLCVCVKKKATKL